MRASATRGSRGTTPRWALHGLFLRIRSLCPTRTASIPSSPRSGLRSMISADWSSRLLVDAPVAAIALPTEGQPAEEVDQVVSQLAKRLARLTDSTGNTAVIRAIRRAQFEALGLSAELYLHTLDRSDDDQNEVERRYAACVASFAEQVLARETALVKALVCMKTAAHLIGP